MRIGGWHLPLDQVSASSLSALITCPEQWRLRRIQNIPESYGPDKFIGTVDHETHEYNFSQKIETGTDLALEPMNEVYRARWDDNLVEEQPVWDDREPEALQEHGLLMMRLYHEQVSPTVTPLHVEERFEHMVPGVPVPLVGYIDLETQGEIIDRKTTKTRLSKPKVKWKFQGQLYSMVYDKPVEWHLVTKQVTPQICLPDESNELRLEVPDADLVNKIILQAVEMLDDLWCRYGPDQPWPMTGLFHDWACNYCGFGPKFGRQCAAWKEPDVEVF